MKTRLTILCLSIGLFTTAGLCAQSTEPTFPYQALVKTSSAKVFSGPASVHYATETLEQGAVVDVYRHDPGGWCAIRPPVGSFSLLPESAITKTQANLARVNEEGIKVWVGTRLGAVEKPLWQVKLRKDELVEILGEVSWPHPDGHSTIWYQISPPSGEFRWIQLADIEPPKHQNDLPQAQNIARNNGSSFEASDSQVRLAGFQSADPEFEDAVGEEVTLDPPSQKDATINRGWRPATTPIRVADRRNEVAGNSKPFKFPAIEGPSKVDPTSAPVLDSLPAIESASSASKLPDSLNLAPINGPVSQRIGLLESSLTAEMLKSPAEWQLESILRQATSIASSTNDANERKQAQRLMAKVRKCVSIQSKFDVAYNSNASGNQTNERSVPVGSNIDNDVQFGTTYDAYGWLNQLVRGKGSQTPTYVIEDDSGRILYHVAPSPGLNLNRYLKSKVGVVGRRGYHRELQLDHVTAERIVVIDSLRR